MLALLLAFLITGTVLDSSGAPVPDATVRLESSGITIAEDRTAADGRFEFSTEAPSLRLVVTVNGFAPAMQPVSSETAELRITLQPAGFFEAVSVTSSRSDAPRADPTVAMTVIPASELLSSAAVTLDDALKMVPGFTLFRRTPSRTAHPTTQGAALRGIGGSAQSRSLVLVDGVPLNDAFGGWVYWNKIPQVAVDRVEVQRGSGSDLYGADAVSGVIQFFTQRPTRPTGRVLAEGGNLGTGRVSAFGGARAGGLRYSAGGEWFNIDGYIPVAEEQEPGNTPRGPIDSEVGSTHRSAMGSAGYQAANGWRVAASGNVYSEDRQNATPLGINTTASRQGAAEVAGGAGGGLLTVRAFGGTQQYRQTFVSVAADRASERLVRDQNVPTTFVGVGGQWFLPAGRHALLMGADGRYIKGSTIETPFAASGLPLATTEAGGTQKLGSVFVQDSVPVTDRFTVVAGAHADMWLSETLGTSESRTLSSFNPRVAASYRIGESGVTVRGAVYHGFRAPTLNEFYRGFRAGNTQVLPNDQLDPERLTGGEAGIVMSRGPASARVTVFRNVLNDAVTTVTISTTPQLITRQRANADVLRAVGVEVEGDLRLPYDFSVGFASVITSSQFAGDTDLRGNDVPQVPPYSVGLNVRYNGLPWTASAQWRVTGPTFEDDLNTLTLRRATVLDVLGSRTIAGRVNVFVAVENLFDATYDVGRTPFLTIGLPRAARAGVLITLP